LVGSFSAATELERDSTKTTQRDSQREIQSATEDTEEFERVFDREECPGYKTVL
jgi:hypothetical protein